MINFAVLHQIVESSVYAVLRSGTMVINGVFYYLFVAFYKSLEEGMLKRKKRA